MFAIQQDKNKIIRNTLIRHVADNLSSLWTGQSTSVWLGDFNSGHCYWRGDDGNEFIVIWNSTSLLAAASILECSRALEEQ